MFLIHPYISFYLVLYLWDHYLHLISFSTHNLKYQTYHTTKIIKKPHQWGLISNKLEWQFSNKLEWQMYSIIGGPQRNFNISALGLLCSQVVMLSFKKALPAVCVMEEELHSTAYTAIDNQLVALRFFTKDGQDLEDNSTAHWDLHKKKKEKAMKIKKGKLGFFLFIIGTNE